MLEPAAFEADGGSLQNVADWPSASTEADLDTLVSQAVGCEYPIAIHDDGKMVGVVDKDALLRGIQGEA